MPVFRGLLCLICVWPTIVSGQSPQLVAETEPLTAEEQLAKFHLPPGFKIELVAAEPECRKPMNLKFDAAGRLWFTQSIEYPWPVAEGTAGRDTIRVLTDTNGDGVPDAVSVFADGLNIPIGITPIHEGVLGYSIPALYHFRDTNGDGIADERREWYSKFGFRDTHGMCSSLNWWIDGWVYGCHGFSNESKVQGADGNPIVMQSGNTYRLRPDGSKIEYVTHGQVNPFGMAFDPLGNQYTSDCHTKPAYLILRGAYYPSFGKPHDGLGFGPELLQHLHGSTGIAGIVYYAAEHFPREFRDNLLIGNPVTGRINRDTLEAHGSTYRAIEQPDFLSCDDPWFRPVDLQLAPDGSLYIADFYNRIIGHYEVPLTHPGRDRERGRIWRVSYVGPEGTQRAPRIPDLTRASQTELVAALAHEHLPVRVQATHQLVHRIGPAAIPELTTTLAQSPSAPQRMHALWALERISPLPESTLLHLDLDPDRLVRVHLAKLLAEREGWSPALRRLMTEQLLTDADPFVRRATVDALGRHAAPGLERRLVEVWLQTPRDDAFLIHTAKMAVRDVLVSQNSFEGIDPGSWSNAERRCLQEALLGAHVSGAAQLALRLFAIEPWDDDLAPALTQHTVRYLPAADEEGLPTLARWLQTRPVGVQLAVLRAAQRGSQERGQPLAVLWKDWAEQLAAARLADRSDGANREGLELVRDLKLTGSSAALLQRLQGANQQPQVLALVIEALAAIDHPELIATAGELLAREDVPVDVRQQCAQVLGGLNQNAARDMLRLRLTAAPADVARAIARGLAVTPAGAAELLSLMEGGKVSSRLLQDATVMQRLRNGRIPQFDERAAELVKGLPDENEDLLRLIAERKAAYLSADADIERGRKVFEKTCAACHRLEGKGAKVGPELDGVGLRGLDRLLEDTLDPSRNVDAAFRSTTLVLNNGRVLNGLVAREAGAVLILIDEQGKELEVLTADIDERQQTKLSPMPANVGEKLSAAEYNDLLRYLLSQRIRPQTP